MVTQHVDLAHVLVRIGLEPFAGQRHGLHRTGVLADLAELLLADLQSLADLVVGGFASQFHLQALACALDLAGAAAHEAGNPVHGAQLVEDRATDARGTVGFKLHTAVQVERVDGVHEPEGAG